MQPGPAPWLSIHSSRGRWRGPFSGQAQIQLKSTGAYWLNQNRTQRYLQALIVLAGVFVGNSIGALIDQAAALTIDPALWLAVQICGYCLEAALPLAGSLVNVNRWTIIGTIAGLVIGLVVALVVRWYFRPR